MAALPLEATPALVGRAWCDVLGLPRVGTSTWEEAGGDSLATLNLLLALELALGRKLSFDLIQPDMTAVQLAAALAPSPPAPEAGPGEPPTVFLFPGMFGDEPRLAAFRRSFGGRLRFELLEHPDVGAPRALLTDMAATGRIGAAAIGRRQPIGPICLAGYSFGGGVAFEAARHLRADGHQVAFLGLIDAPLAVTALPMWEGLRRTALLLLAHTGAGRRTLLRAIALFLPKWKMAARRQLLRRYRYAAIRRWRPALLQVPSLLVASEEFGDGLVGQWRRLCPGIGVLCLSSTHDGVFEPAFLEALVPAFEQALHAAVEATGRLQGDVRR